MEGQPSRRLLFTDAQDADQGDESKETYRLGVDWTRNDDDHDAGQHAEVQHPGVVEGDANQGSSSSSSLQRLSKSLSREVLWRRSSSFKENLPETPAGWAVLLSVLTAVGLGYEIRLQRSLTCPPLVYGQSLVGGGDEEADAGPLRDIYNQMTASPESILVRNIQPSLFVGTRGVLSSTAAYLLGGPPQNNHDHQQSSYLQFREILTMAQDGARIALDWELPPIASSSNNADSNHDESISTDVKQRQQRKSDTLHGPIHDPVVLILHGINNDVSFGYMRSMMRACTNRGWIAVGMNFRGCGGIPLATPRGYTGGYTGDLRCVVNTLSRRMTSTSEGVVIPRLFIVGHSLGASLVTKYLGEEGLSETLPSCVAGGAALGNPLHMNSPNIDWLSSALIALGAKKSLLENWSSIRQMKDPVFQSAIRRALMAVTLADFDEALAPIFARNDPVYPFAFRIGYRDGASYWNDTGSYRLVRYISVPMLQLIASDDFLVYQPFRGRMMYSMANPNVLTVETKCGGHLGWHESPPGGPRYGVGTSWAEAATTDFIEATLHTIRKKSESSTTNPVTTTTVGSPTVVDMDSPYDLRRPVPELHLGRSRL